MIINNAEKIRWTLVFLLLCLVIKLCFEIKLTEKAEYIIKKILYKPKEIDSLSPQDASSQLRKAYELSNNREEYDNENDNPINKSLNHKLSYRKSDNQLIKEKHLENEFNDSLIPPELNYISVETDLVRARISLVGGDVVSLELINYPVDTNKENQSGFKIFDISENKFYIAESGLIIKDLVAENGILEANNINKKITYTAVQKDFDTKNSDYVNVDLTYETNKIKIIKLFTFKKNSYVINVSHIVKNKTTNPLNLTLRAALKRSKPEEGRFGIFGAIKTYVGAAVTTNTAKYERVTFDSLDKKPYSYNMTGKGWVAMVEHYFASSWILTKHKKYQVIYEGKRYPRNIYSIGFIDKEALVMPQETKVFEADLFAGPEVAGILKDASPGLELTIDYGILWWLCQPIFILLTYCNKVLHNWGLAIIFTTLIIKMLFYKFAASSYQSMAKIKKLQPKLDAIKQTYENDKQKLGQEIMSLYKQEKVNPLGGCLPVIIQIPVFISLYYVLLESIELRHAPFFGWIHDLSSKDPLYVLPILMGVSMLIQQKLFPSSQDPTQAKIMMIMPVFLVFLFLQFPSGLVLYWVVNNILSIAQQWYIHKKSL